MTSRQATRRHSERLPCSSAWSHCSHVAYRHFVRRVSSRWKPCGSNSPHITATVAKLVENEAQPTYHDGRTASREWGYQKVAPPPWKGERKIIAASSIPFQNSPPPTKTARSPAISLPTGSRSKSLNFWNGIQRHPVSAWILEYAIISCSPAA